MEELKPWDKYYYCPDCHTFHEYGSERAVSRKLCFVCDKRGAKKAKIVGSDSIGYLQVCDECITKVRAFGIKPMPE
jgi:hypothetical protein